MLFCHSGEVVGEYQMLGRGNVVGGTERFNVT